MSLIGRLFKDETLDKLFDKIDTVVDTIPDQIDDRTAEDLASETVREYINSFTKNKEDQTEIHQIISNLTVPSERLNRYNVYDEIYRSVQLVKKIIRTYVFNILQQDLITGRTYIFKKNEDHAQNISTSKYNQQEHFVKDVFEYYNLENVVRNLIVPKWLRYGDFFIRIVDLEETFEKIPQVQPSYNSTTSVTKITEDEAADIIFDTCFITETTKIKKTREQVIQDTDSEHNIDDSNSIKYNLNRISLEYIPPHQIVLLKAKNSSLTLGYVYIKEYENASMTAALANNPTMQMASIFNQISGSLRNEKFSVDEVIHKLTDKLVTYILKEFDIDKKLIDFNPSAFSTEGDYKKAYEQFIRDNINNEDVFYLIKELLFQDPHKNKLQQKRFKVEFIPVDRMVHFQIPSSEYFPYGESIVDPLVYPAKLYLINQLANVIIKLSRAAVIRKWIVETGPRDIHSNLLQKLRKEFRNQRITADDILSFKSIPRILSDFKDLVIFSKKGQRFIDVETTALGDPNTKIQDVEDSRRELISLSGVPAAYLGQADIADLRDQLVNANISFANDIAVMQDIVTDALSDLINKISAVFFNPDDDLYEPCRYVKISLTPPVILMLQLIESTVSSIGNIFQTFQSISGVRVDPYYLLERYMPYIDWKAFKDAANKFKVETTTSGDEENQ